MGSHEEDLPASQLTPEASARIPKPDGDEERSFDPEAAQSSWSQAAERVDGTGSRPPCSVMMWPTLKNRKQFDLVYSQGRKRTSKSLVVFYLDSAPDQRVAYVASRKVGGAVQRNRAKRLLRVAFRQVAASRNMPAGWFVLVARGRILEGRSPDVEREFASMLDALERAAASGAEEL